MDINVGQIIETRCSRCKDITGHNVMVCNNGVPLKVECRACGSVHKYVAVEQKRSEIKTTTVRVKAGQERIKEVEKVSNALPSAPVQAKKTKINEKNFSEQWQAAVNKIISSPIPYSLDIEPTSDSLISHTKFGIGVVLHILEPGKFEVLFKEGTKVLRCKA